MIDNDPSSPIKDDLFGRHLVISTLTTYLLPSKKININKGLYKTCIKSPFDMDVL